MEVKDRTTSKKDLVRQESFLSDMRFWLIIVMLAAFVSFLIFVNPA